ncbi:MAG TPA: hypothetical protein VHO50_07050 [Bacteroidales bacterium]|nr:hypothetical protein [Bacteroidales bacterium]
MTGFLVLLIAMIILFIIISKSTSRQVKTGKFSEDYYSLATYRTPQRENLNKSKHYELVTIKSLERYMCVMDSDIFIEMSTARLNGHTYMEIDKNKLVAMEKKLTEHLAYENKLSECASLNNQGVDYEKAGNITQAIKTYESNIKEGCYPASHSFDRLMILYRKAKDYNSELRVIDRAIEIIGERNPALIKKYQDRKEKVFLLMNKKNSKI